MSAEKSWWRRLGVAMSVLATAAALLIGVYQVWGDFFGPKIITFQPSNNSRTVVRGDTIVFTWRVDGNPADVLLDGERVPANGQRSFERLMKDHIFRLEARGRWGRPTESLFPVKVVMEAAINASPSSVKPGADTVVSWTVLGNPERVQIEPILGTVGPRGRRAVSLVETTTFRIIAARKGLEDALAETTVEVLQTQLVFKAEPVTIHKGETTKLLWQTNSESIEISPSVGTFPGFSGEASISPTESTTYEAVVEGPGGAQRRSVSVTVLPALSPTIRAWAVPQQVTVGQFATIQWQTTNANKVVVEYGGATREFSPDDRYQLHFSTKGTAQIQLAAIGEGGKQRTSLQVEVLPPPPPKVMILGPDTRLGFGGSTMSDEMTTVVSAYFKDRGYEILLPPSYVRSLEQFVELSRSQRQTNFQMPDIVVQASLQLQQETRKPTKAQLRDLIGSTISQILTGRSQNYVEDRFVEVVITGASTIHLVRMPLGQDAGGTSGSAHQSKIVDKRETPALTDPRSELSRNVGRQAIENALSKLSFPPVEQ